MKTEKNAGFYLSERVVGTIPPIMHVMKNLASGGDLIDLSQGVPFFPPPKEAINKALEELDSLHRYGPDGGDLEFREEICRKLARRNHIKKDPETEIVVTAGANMGFFLSVAAICDVGDEVILFDPYYFNHLMSLDILGVKCVHVGTDENYRPDLEILEKAISPKTRAVVLVSPNNPTGASYPEEIVRKITEMCCDRGIWLISDETYEEYVYDTPHFSPGSLGEDLPIISLFSLSKIYGISGWRVAYAAFPKVFNESLIKVQDATMICASRIGQKVAFHCIRDHDGYLQEFFPKFKENRNLIIDWLERNKDTIEAPVPTGAYYVFPRLKTGKYESMNSMEVVKKVLEQSSVLLVPGGPFGADFPPYFRISFGNVEPARLKIALERLDEVFS